jgi:hypothetical protein
MPLGHLPSLENRGKLICPKWIRKIPPQNRVLRKSGLLAQQRHGNDFVIILTVFFFASRKDFFGAEVQLPWDPVFASRAASEPTIKFQRSIRIGNGRKEAPWGLFVSGILKDGRQKNLWQKNGCWRIWPPRFRTAIFLPFDFFAFLLVAAEGRAGFDPCSIRGLYSYSGAHADPFH